jgi:hypothetical protein
MVTCTCGYRASDGYVAMADVGSRCKVSPFLVSEGDVRVEA